MAIGFGDLARRYLGGPSSPHSGPRLDGAPGSRSPKAKEPRGRAREAGPESEAQRGVCSPLERCPARGRWVKIWGRRLSTFHIVPPSGHPPQNPTQRPLIVPSFLPSLLGCRLGRSAPRQRGLWAARPSFSAPRALKGVVGFRTPRLHSRVLREPVFRDPGRKARRHGLSETEEGIQASWFSCLC